ncbi:MAG: PLD nuclease N-terminal domain-containing protein [Cyclobacteriaceae bacterium]|nr:PLD nuclease N-terminal domain-containing protein [Cyclobacteriaceae bacterium]
MSRLFYVLIIVIDVLAILDVWKQEASMEKRLLWIVIILVFPLLGPLAWYLVSRKIIKL